MIDINKLIRCGPCKALTPVLLNLVQGGGDGIKLLKLNYDTNKAMVNALQVTSLPSVFVFKQVNKKIKKHEYINYFILNDELLN